MFDNQTRGALSKAWKGYVIAKNKYEYDKIEYYAYRNQKLQRELGLKASLFSGIRLLSDSDDDYVNRKAKQEEQYEEERLRSRL